MKKINSHSDSTGSDSKMGRLKALKRKPKCEALENVLLIPET